MSVPPEISPDLEVGPGKSVRFGVGSSTGPRSSTWMMVSAKNTTDFYLAARSIAGVQKVSFHQSGSWAHSFLNPEAAAPFVSAGASRHLDIWQRPAPFQPGWTRAYKIVVPWTELRAQAAAERKAMVWAPDPGLGHWTLIHVVVADPGAPTRLVLDGEIRFLVNMTLTDGSEVKLFASRVKVDSKASRSLANARNQVLLRTAGALSQVDLSDRSQSLRMGIYGNEDDGTRTWWDLALVGASPDTAVICTGPGPAAGLRGPIRIDT